MMADKESTFVEVFRCGEDTLTIYQPRRMSAEGPNFQQIAKTNSDPEVRDELRRRFETSDDYHMLSFDSPGGKVSSVWPGFDDVTVTGRIRSKKPFWDVPLGVPYRDGPFEMINLTEPQRCVLAEMDFSKLEERAMAHAIAKGPAFATDGVVVVGADYAKDLDTVTVSRMHYEGSVVIVDSMRSMSLAAAFAASQVRGLGMVLHPREDVFDYQGIRRRGDRLSTPPDPVAEAKWGEFRQRNRDGVSPHKSAKGRAKKKLAKQSKRRNRK